MISTTGSIPSKSVAPKGDLSWSQFLRIGKYLIEQFTLIAESRMVNVPKRSPPIKPKNKSRRAREHLTAGEIKEIWKAAKELGRYGHRNALMIQMAYRHALRVGEVVTLRWEQICCDDKTVYVHRLKNGIPTTHFLEADELKALSKLRKQFSTAEFVFCNQNGEQMTRRNIHYIVASAGKSAGIPFPIHPHMFRHAKGYDLAKRGIDTRAIQEYMGHADINCTVGYTKLAPNRFRGFGRDV